MVVKCRNTNTRGQGELVMESFIRWGSVLVLSVRVDAVDLDNRWALGEVGGDDDLEGGELGAKKGGKETYGNRHKFTDILDFVTNAGLS